MNTIYSLSSMTADGKVFSFEELKGKVVMIVNTASACGFTPQYQTLQQLYEKYKSEGFEILAFPSNDFGAQEPLTGRKINIFCQDRYAVEFPVMDRVNVKGKHKHQVFTFLSDRSLNGHTSLGPLWNFQKYLIDKKGYVRHYFLPVTDPASKRVVRRIEQLLHENI